MPKRTKPKPILSLTKRYGKYDIGPHIKKMRMPYNESVQNARQVSYMKNRKSRPSRFLDNWQIYRSDVDIYCNVCGGIIKATQPFYGVGRSIHLTCARNYYGV